MSDRNTDKPFPMRLNEIEWFDWSGLSGVLLGMLCALFSRLSLSLYIKWISFSALYYMLVVCTVRHYRFYNIASSTYILLVLLLVRNAVRFPFGCMCLYVSILLFFLHISVCVFVAFFASVDTSCVFGRFVRHVLFLSVSFWFALVCCIRIGIVFHHCLWAISECVPRQAPRVFTSFIYMNLCMPILLYIYILYMFPMCSVSVYPQRASCLCVCVCVYIACCAVQHGGMK